MSTVRAAAAIAAEPGAPVRPLRLSRRAGRSWTRRGGRCRIVRTQRAAGGKSPMPNVDPPASPFLAIATVNAGMCVWLRAGIARVEAGLSVTDERMARIDGALGRPLPERMARAPGAEDGAGGRYGAARPWRTGGTRAPIP